MSKPLGSLSRSLCALATFACSVAGGFSALASDEAPTPKLNVHMLYWAQKSEVKADVQAWINLLRLSVDSMISSQLSPDQGAADVSPGVSFVETEVAQAPDHATLEAHWNNGSQSLSAVGMVAVQASGFARVDSEVYFGQYSGSLRSKYVSLSQLLDPTAYQANRDTMMFVTLYSYAMFLAEQAHVDGSSRAQICEMLGQAWLVGDGVRSEQLLQESDNVRVTLLRSLEDELSGHQCGTR
jgi:hypothetical protein